MYLSAVNNSMIHSDETDIKNPSIQIAMVNTMSANLPQWLHQLYLSGSGTTNTSQ
jgi:hypothetical protein